MRSAERKVEKMQIRNPKSEIRNWWLIGAVVLFCLLAGTPRVYGADYVIGSADVLFISVLGNTELDTVARVTPTGTISVPLVGDVQAAGLTAGEKDKKPCGVREPPGDQ